MEKVKKSIAALIIFFMFIGGLEGLRYLVTDDTESYTRIMMHEFYNQSNIDIMFVGASHVHRSFMPTIIDDRLGENTFNAGSSGQPLDVSYALIKEAVDLYDVEHVYVDLSYLMACEKFGKERDLVTGIYLISDYMRPSLNKLDLLLNATSSSYYANNFLIAKRDWKKLFDPDYLEMLFKKKNSSIYQDYEYGYVTNEGGHYLGKGYVSSKNSISTADFFLEDKAESVNLRKINPQYLKIIDDIITFCESNDVEVTFVSVPIPTFFLATYKDYDEYVEVVRKIIEGRGAEYWDFNFCRESFFPDDLNYFMDTNHLNQAGGEIFSNLFSDLVTGKFAPEEVFYSNREEKLRSLPDKIYGIIYDDEINAKGERIKRKAEIIPSRSRGIEYKITVCPEDKKTEVIQNFSENREFEIDANGKGTIQIMFRLEGKSASTKTVEITY